MHWRYSIYSGLYRTLLKVDQISLYSFISFKFLSIRRASRVTWNIAVIKGLAIESFQDVLAEIINYRYDNSLRNYFSYRIEYFDRYVMAYSKHMTSMCSIVLMIMMCLTNEICYRMITFILWQEILIITCSMI